MFEPQGGGKSLDLVMDLNSSAPDDYFVAPSSIYSYRPPSPPHIHVPPIKQEQRLVLPAFEGIAGENITQEDLRTITQLQYEVGDVANQWKYESRRKAQMIVPFLYLGPASGARDRDFLRQEEITMLLVIRDTKSAQARLLSGDKVAQELGIESASVDVAGNWELIAAFPKVIKVINDHLLHIYRQQAVTGTKDGSGRIIIDQQTFKKGKVLVFCESGNERSATVVTAYLMAMYGQSLVNAVQFVQAQRFCVALDDTLKGLLQSWEDIIQAQRDVGQANFQQHVANQSSPPPTSAKYSKRHFDDAMDEDEDETTTDMNYGNDSERFEGRRNFVPFVDSGPRFHPT